MPGYRVEQLPLEKIRWPEQERKAFDPDALAALTEAVRAHGVAQAITVVPNDQGGYDGLLGQRRLLAARAAGLKTIPAVIRDAAPSTAEAIGLRLGENVARSDLNPIELADGLARLMEAGGMTAAQAGGQVGLSGPEVSKALALTRLPESIREAIRSRRISASAGYALSQVTDSVEQTALAERVAAGELGRDQITGARRQVRAAPPSPDREGPRRVAAPLGDGRTVVVTGPGIDSMDGLIGCLEELLAKARRARPQGIEVRTFAKMLRDQRGRQPAAGG